MDRFVDLDEAAREASAPFYAGGNGFHAAEERRAGPLLPTVDVRCVATLADTPVPERSWLVRDLIPDKTVTMLGGDGGVGKSLLALQLAAATSRGTDWAGTLPTPGPVLYISAEDDLDELHRRLADIAAASGEDLAVFTDLHLLPLAGLEAVLGAADGKGLISATPLLHAVTAKVVELRPRLLVVDNLADAFAGNENSRPEARQFVGILRGIAIKHELAVVLISHPSLTGLSSGTGTSGSTAWSNSVRSRLYLDRAKAESGEEPDPALRVLRLLKANYAPTGTEIKLKWEAGRFRLDDIGPGSFDRMAAEQRAEHVFLALVRRYTEQGRDASPNPSSTYAPTLFAREPDARGMTAGVLASAMTRLFADRKIEVEKVGPQSKPRSRIRVSD